MTQVFLLNTGGADATWPDPGNWNPVNTVEMVGSGCQGGAGQGASGAAGGGGSGGGYAQGSNLQLTFPVSYNMLGNVTGFQYYSCNFNTTTSNAFTSSPGPNIVSAACAVYAQYNGSAGGPASRCWPTGFGGGTGGSAPGFQAGGGGGAAGPHGAGSNSVTPGSGDAPGTAGGAADNGTVAGGASGAPGNSGTQWDSSHGCGSGGGGGTSSVKGQIGGSFGGGGGGGYGNGTSAQRAGGVGGPSLCIITYTPFIPASGVTAQMVS